MSYSNIFGNPVLLQTASKIVSAPTPAPHPTPTPAPAPHPAPTPAPHPTPTTTPTPACIYNPHDQLALQMRKIIFGAPAICQQMISDSFWNFSPRIAEIDFYVINKCSSYLGTILSTYYPNYNPTSVCLYELTSLAQEYVRVYPGGTVCALPTKSCMTYLSSFVADVLNHPSDSVHLAGCNATLSAALLPN